NARYISVDGFSAGGAVAAIALANDWEPPYGTVIGYVFEDAADIPTVSNPGGKKCVYWASYNGATWNANDINEFDVITKYETALGGTRQRMDPAAPAGPTTHAPMTRTTGGSGPYAVPEELTDEWWSTAETHEAEGPLALTLTLTATATKHAAATG